MYQKQNVTDEEAVFLAAVAHCSVSRLGASEVGVDVVWKPDQEAE